MFSQEKAFEAMKIPFVVLTVALCTLALIAASAGTIQTAQLLGEYRTGQSLAVKSVLKLSRNGTFEFRRSGCFGKYDENGGKFKIQDGVLHLYPEGPNISKVTNDLKGMETSYLPIRWDDRLYLIAIKEMAAFCSEVNFGSEPDHHSGSNFYLRDGDENKPTTGLPELPSEWQSYLLKHPVTGKITAFLSKDVAVIDLGSNDGLKQGMFLVAHGGEHRYATIELIRVEASYSEAKVYVSNENVLLGDEVSSNAWSKQTAPDVPLR